MNLAYTIPHAEENIKSGKKIHTLRDDKGNRWKQGMLIHHCTGLRSPRYRCFLKNQCISIQFVVIYNKPSIFAPVEIYVDNEMLCPDQVKELALNDGFENVEDFKKWFFKIKGKKTWVGKIIHWTEKRYTNDYAF